MNFLAPIFLAGLVAAAAPTVIHLINRRRYRTVQWAAMDFLRDAIRRNRRLIRLRDLLLLLLRTAAVALFVLAMARPYWVSDEQQAFDGQPVHAVLVVDNSLSMGYTQLDRSLLETARDKARTFVQSLPDGSEISLIPTCTSAQWHVKDVYTTPADALDALARIELSDRAAHGPEALERAAQACRAASAIPTKRVVVLSDMQRGTWSADAIAEPLARLPDVQLVQVAPTERTNTWVDEFQLRDGLADAASETVFNAVLRHEGPPPPQPVRVELSVGGETIQERFVSMETGQHLRLVFKHRFDVAGTSREPLFVPAELKLSADHLPADDVRHIVVPVVARVPVVFVDELGPEENPDFNRYGESFHLRRLLAPETSPDEAQQRRHLVRVLHRRIGELTREDLREARLVVIAGVKSPTPQTVDLLREYVWQGGAILLAGGAEFDPIAWNDLAWRDGAGILPLPLRPEPVGKVPEPNEANPQAFHLDIGSMQDPAFYLGLPDAQREDLLAGPEFYKSLAVDTEAEDRLARAERERIQSRRAWLAEHDANERRWARMEAEGKLTDIQAARRTEDRQKLARLKPDWLAWQNPLTLDEDADRLEPLLRKGRPRVMGRYTNGLPFAIRRDIGRGRVVMVTTGVRPVWNTMAVDYSVLLLDSVLRELLTRSLPARTLEGVNEVVVPVSGSDRSAEFQLARPGESQPEPLRIEAIGADRYGVLIRGTDRRGLYRLTWSAGGEQQDAAREMLLAVNGPGAESDPTGVDRERFMEDVDAETVRWLAADEPIRLEGKTYIGYDFWKYLAVLAFAALLAEMLFLGATGGGTKGGPA